MTRDGSEAWKRSLVVSGQVAEIAAASARLDVDAVYDDAKEPS